MSTYRSTTGGFLTAFLLALFIVTKVIEYGRRVAIRVNNFHNLPSFIWRNLGATQNTQQVKVHYS